MGNDTYASPAASAVAAASAVEAPSGTAPSGTANISSAPSVGVATVPQQLKAEVATWLSTPTAGYGRTPIHQRTPAPRLRQLIGVCGWAAVLGAAGFILGIRSLLGQIYGNPPGWYQPIIVLTGLIGIGLTVGAFLTVHHLRRPWWLLGSASGALVTGMLLTALAF